MEDIVLPSNLEIINSRAFEGCYSLKDIVFSKNMFIIKADDFKNCGDITLTISTNTYIHPMEEENFDLNIIFYKPKEELYDGQCTFIETGGEMVFQNFFACRNCNYYDGKYICEVCARKCHKDHDVCFVGFFKGFCECGAGNNSCYWMYDKAPKRSNPKLIKGPCTLNESGKEFVMQPFFRCITCRFSSDEGCCEYCARTCHLGHTLIYRGVIPSFCDCGNENPDCKCRRAPKSRSKVSIK